MGNVIKTRAGVRILTPQEYDTYTAHINKLYHKTIFEVLFWTGMRYVEMQRLYENKSWWWRDRKTIHLPKEAQKKVKRKQLERYITPVSPALESSLDYFFSNQKPPTLSTWDENLKRWADNSGIGKDGISAKTTRATIESWMITANLPLHKVCLRQGHDNLTSMNHYQALPFTQPEKDEITRRLSWFV